MRRNLVAIVSVGTALLLTACEGDRSTSPSLTPSASSFTKTPPVTCDFPTLNTDAKAFFKSGDVVFTMLSDMKTLQRTSNAAATPKGFDILARTAAVRYTSAQLAGSTADNGATFVNDLLKCMDVGAIPATFNAALALGQGVFAVEGPSSPDTWAVAYNATLSGAKVASSPAWGVEPKAAWPTAGGAGDGRFLLYGYPISTTDFGGETPADGFNAFEVGTLRNDVAKNGMRVGICTKLLIAGGSAANLMFHNDSIVTNESPTFCDHQPLAKANMSWMTRLASLFSPSIAFAQEDFGRDFIGGGPSSWSPMKFSKVAGSNMNLTFTTQPRNAGVTTDVPAFTVHAATAAGHPMPGVVITLEVFGNNGVPANALIVAGQTMLTTGPGGNVVFSGIRMGKAGGYTLTAAGSNVGVQTNSAVSALFNIKNK